MIFDPLASRAIANVLRHPGALNDGETLDAARERYFATWWAPYRWCDLPIPLAVKVFDCAIPDGAASAIRALQRACRAAGQPVKEDGVLGGMTLRAAGRLPVIVTLAALKSELAAHFRLVAAANPKRSGELPAWLERAYEDLGGWDSGPVPAPHDYALQAR
jgi:lysozyme family protein